MGEGEGADRTYFLGSTASRHHHTLEDGGDAQGVAIGEGSSDFSKRPSPSP